MSYNLWLLWELCTHSLFTIPGRKENCVCLYYTENAVTGKIVCKTKGKGCGWEMQGIIARMKQHHDSCIAATCINDQSSEADSLPGLQSRKHKTSPPPISQRMKKQHLSSVNDFCANFKHQKEGNWSSSW